jgi:hypothetical protein
MLITSNADSGIISALTARMQLVIACCGCGYQKPLSASAFSPLFIYYCQKFGSPIQINALPLITVSKILIGKQTNARNNSLMKNYPKVGKSRGIWKVTMLKISSKVGNILGSPD